MRALWPTLIAPLLEACRPGTVVELPARHTELAELLDETAAELGATVAGGTVDAAVDLALIHGRLAEAELSEELDRLGEAADSAGAPFPLTLVHGVDDPLGGAEVLAAVEAFLEDHDEELELIHVPGLGGTAILAPPRRLEGDSNGLASLLEGWRLGPQALSQLALVEAERLRGAAHAEELAAELQSARSGLQAQDSAEREALRQRLEKLAERESELAAVLARREARLAALEEAAIAAGTEPAAPPAPTPASPAPEQLTVSPQPQPVDRRGLLVAEGGEGALRAQVRMTGPVEAMRRCLWSLISRADRPLQLTLVTGPDSGADLRELAEEVAAHNPEVAVRAAPDADDPTAWRLSLDRPVVFGHQTLGRLIAAAERSGSPRVVAAAAAEALAVPPWANLDAPALLSPAAEDGAVEALAAPCVVFPPGSSAEKPAVVALDAVVSDPGRELPGAAEAVAGTAAFADEEALATALRESLCDPLAIAYVLPGLPSGGSGGSHSVLQEARALAALGARSRVLVEQGGVERARELYPEAGDLLVAYGSGELDAALDGFDVIVATEAPSARLVAQQAGKRRGVLGAYYVQDYEPLFSPPTGPSADAALLSYRQTEGLLLFAKTHWVANVVGAAHDVPVAKVEPSLDRATFHADGRDDASRPRVLAMIRPRTPRRRAAETLAALTRLDAELGDAVECLAFGCTEEDLAGLPPAPGVRQLGILRRAEVAEALRRCDLFLDLSAYQAFGRTGLEAMACGAVPLLPLRGGVTEYAAHDRNALLVDTTDEDAVVAAAAALLGDRARLERLRAAGLATASSFSTIGAAVSQYACFAAHRAAAARP